MSEINEAELLAGKVRRGEQVTAQEMQTVFKTADAAGVLYYQMLTMVREQRSLSELPETLKKIIKTEAWKGWRWVGSSFGQNSLRAYLTSPPPNGVGIQLDTVRKLIEGDEEAETLYEAEMRDRPGGDRQSKRAKSINNNIINASPPKQGTSRAYTLTRLKRERPEITEALARAVTGR
jgi:hypothetical protein